MPERSQPSRSTSQIEYPTEYDPKKGGPVVAHRKACPREDLHTDKGVGAIQWDAWANRMARTHRQVRCPGCTLFSIWVPKVAASS